MVARAVPEELVGGSTPLMRWGAGSTTPHPPQHCAREYFLRCVRCKKKLLPKKIGVLGKTGKLGVVWCGGGGHWTPPLAPALKSGSGFKNSLHKDGGEGSAYSPPIWFQASARVDGFLFL